MHNKIQLREEDKNAPWNPQIVNPCYTFTHQDQNEFLGMEKDGKTVENAKERA